eukprot:3148637-Pyramimonas_sp.AAC.1
MKIADHQIRHGRFFAFEHPLFATSWDTQVVRAIAELPEVRRIRVDTCTCGLSVTGKGLNKKPTG